MKKLPVFQSKGAAIEFLWIFYAVGVLGLLIPFTNPLFRAITPFSLILSGIILFYYHPRWKLSEILVFCFVAIAGFFAEVVGVGTGLIFGEYAYGRTLGLKLFETPVIIGFNWILLIYCTHSMVQKYKWRPALKIFAASLLMVVYDLALEPGARYLDMWDWATPRVPIQNYLAWFGFSLLFHGAFYIARVKIFNPLAFVIFTVQFLFFVLIGLFYYISSYPL